jgi:hypothetical protein
MKRTFSIFLSMLVVLIMLVGYAGAESTDSTQDELLEDEYYFPEYGANTFEILKSESNVLVVRGKVPEIQEDKEKIKWLNTIKECIHSSENELHPSMKEFGGPLVGFGTNYGGYLFVEFDPELEKDVDIATTEKFYNVINSHAKEKGISDIPVVFRMGEKDIKESQSSYWRPLIGGIKITDILTTDSTICFTAVDNSGNEGYVIAGHAAVDAEKYGGTIYQQGGSVGDVTLIGGYFSDSAWVEYSNVDPEVYYDDTNDVREVHDYYDANLGSKVYKSGEETGLTNGYVTEVYDDKTCSYFGTLHDQYLASYNSDAGDSGGTIFKKYGSKIDIVGIHVGRYGSKAQFSPISGIIADLDVEPLIA